MSDNKISVQNDNDKDVKEDDISKQTSLDTTIDLHADEDEEKDVRGSVLHTEEEHETRRDESKADVKDGSKLHVSLHGEEFTVAYNQPSVGQGGWFQGPPPPPPQQQSWGQQGTPPPPPDGQGWFHGRPPQQQQGWFQQGPPPQQVGDQPSRFGHTYPRHSEYQSSPLLDYSPEKEDRNVFVRKVMILLLVMLLVTSVVMVAVIMSESAKKFFRRYFLFICLPCSIVLIVMSCFMPTSACARKKPTNYICLVVVVVLQSLVCCAITSRYQTEIIFQAFLATLIAVAFCVILAFTKFDFTKWILIILCVVMALIGLALVVLIAHVCGFRSKTLMIIILVAFTIMNIVMLIIELQMVLGGKSVEIGEKDYALGAYLLYTSIVHLFLNLVQLMGVIQS